MIREYGGYLPVDSRGEGYFHNIDSRNIIRLNAARYAIIEALKIHNYDKIWIPVYMCASVPDAIQIYGNIKCEYYNINNCFEPDIGEIGENDCILISNYYGQKGDSFFSEQIKKFENIIFDNTQCFYIHPVMKPGVFNVYSPRKFFGVSDGAYLIGKDVDSSLSLLEADVSARRVGIVFESLEKGTNASYGQYLEAEEDIAGSGVKAMSKVTEALLGNIDYQGIQRKRCENYHTFCKEFDGINEISVNEKAVSPMVYPLVIKDEGLRKRMIDSRIYVPQWWKVVIGNPSANGWEKYVSENLYPLPVDQRYKVEDMLTLAEMVKKLL